MIKRGTFQDENGDGFAQVGETIFYLFRIAIIGDVSLTNITLSDPLPGIVINSTSGGPYDLAPGQSVSPAFTGRYTLTQADLNAGLVVNQAVVTGIDPNGDPVTDDSDNNSDFEDEPTVVRLTVDNCDPAAGNPDTDGDGIANDCDLDDDNDGILDTDEGFIPPSNVTNFTQLNTTGLSGGTSGILGTIGSDESLFQTNFNLVSTEGDIPNVFP